MGSFSRILSRAYLWGKILSLKKLRHPLQFIRHVFTSLCPKKETLQLSTLEQCIMRSHLKDRLIQSKYAIVGLPENSSLLKAIRKTEKTQKYDIPVADHSFLVIKSKFEYQTQSLNSYFFRNFLSFDPRLFIFFVFCISNQKLNSMSGYTCLSFTSRHLELLCKNVIQLSYKRIILDLWLKVPSCNFTEQIIFLYSCEWTVPII